MPRHQIRAVAVLSCVCTVAGCQTAQRRIAARREVTTHVVPAPAEETFTAVIEVLQDRDFGIERIDRDTGLVHARRRTSVSLTGAFRLLRAVVSREARTSMDDGLTYEVSCVVTSAGPAATSVRVLIVRQSPTGPFVEEEAETIYERGLYQRLFDDITAEALRRAAAPEGDRASTWGTPR